MVSNSYLPPEPLDEMLPCIASHTSIHTEFVRYVLLLHHVNKPQKYQMCAGDQTGDTIDEEVC